ncbi:MAG: glutathione S-transferase [Burkholderiaceae bacterium]
MLVLCGFSVSNYYNKVKMVLFEKGVAFTEEQVRTGLKDEATLSSSPLAKIPFIRTERGALCESQAIADYLEAAYPNPQLMPADPWAAAKVRELITFTELHVELVARELYGKAFFGGDISEANAERVRKLLTKNIAAFKRLAKFAPYVAGDAFTLADCAAWVSLPVVAMATRAVYGEDMLAAAGVDWKAYTKMVGERPSAQRVTADRKADQERAAAKP